MTEDDEPEIYVSDPLCERAQAVRNIAADLENTKNKRGREILLRAAEALLVGMARPKGEVLELVVSRAKSNGERPL